MPLLNINQIQSLTALSVTNISNHICQGKPLSGALNAKYILIDHEQTDWIPNLRMESLFSEKLERKYATIRRSLIF